MVCLGGVLVMVAVRLQDSQDVDLIISPENITENISIWSEHIIRSYKPTVSSLRSKLCQVYSSSLDSQACRLSSLGTLTDPGLGYLDLSGYVSLNVRWGEISRKFSQHSLLKSGPGATGNRTYCDGLDAEREHQGETL